MAKFTLTPTKFSAEFSASFGGQIDKFEDLETGNKFDGIGYQADGQLVFRISSIEIPIWADDVEEATLGTTTHFKGNTFTNGQELHALVKAYADTLIGLS